MSSDVSQKAGLGVFRSMKYILIALISLLALPAMAAYDQYVPQAEKVGQGRLTYLMWDVYDASLYAPEGRYEADRPFALRLSYLRNIPAEKIVERSIAEMAEQAGIDQSRLSEWEARLFAFFPEITKGDEVIGVNDGQGTSLFYYNGTRVGMIDDPDFTRSFFDIWLGSDTNVPDLQRKILGKAR